MVYEVLPSRDGVIPKVFVKYRNNQENVDRFTTRAVWGVRGDTSLLL